MARLPAGLLGGPCTSSRLILKFTKVLGSVTGSAVAYPLLLLQTYQIAADAAEKPVEEYATLQEFFTRRLKPGLRPVAAEG